jgi:hypothetical protein
LKLHHAAALVLGLGWYLMVPPVDQTGDYYADPKAPLVQWTIRSSYDTAKKCEKARAKVKGEMSQPHGRLGTVSSFLTMATCIASDDPRLKSN